MGIYLPNMKMPKTPLLVCIYPNGICSDEEGETYRAVPVPPHGRLIDADEIKTAFPCGESVRTECVRATIDNAPTVLEAEEGE